MNRTDIGRPVPETRGATGLAEPIWRYQDACAIDLLSDGPGNQPEDEAYEPAHERHRERRQHLRTR